MGLAGFRGKVAVVTGGASGIGRAVVRRLAVEGVRVVVADLAEDEGRQAAAEVDGRFVALDVSRPEAWDGLVSDVTGALGGIDIAHLNAGVTTGAGELHELTDEQYRRILGANVDGVVFGARAVVPAMAARGGGAIVATASLASLIGFPPDPVYALTKHAVIGFVRSLAPKLAERGISVNAVCPGLVDTPLLGVAAKSQLTAAGFPLMPPEQIADAVVDAMAGGLTGEAWVCQPGRAPERYRFGHVPGPRTEGAEGMVPPAPARGV